MASPATRVAPGVLAGTMTRQFPAATLERIVRAIPTRRLGTMAEVVHAIRYLADPAASFTNGVILQVNGGQLMTG